MLKSQWNIESCGTYANKNTLWHFSSVEDESTSLYLRAIDESEAWSKLGKIVGEEDKEDVVTEVFEGYVCAYDVPPSCDIVDSKGWNVLDPLAKHNGKRAKVTVEIKP